MSDVFEAPETHHLTEDESINDGLGLFIKSKKLYYGSRRGGMSEFKVARETTVGEGVYLTSLSKDAAGYARRRARGRVDSQPTVYTAAIENLKLLDVRKTENIQKILPGFRQVLLEQLQVPGISWNIQEVLHRAIQTIDSGVTQSGYLRDVTFNTGKLFTEYVLSLGYDGLIALEGGEGDDVGNHDTYLIFDPKRIAVEREDQLG